ncbi:putative protein DUF72 [Aromatoleum petrolei]|nr:putative protein DUF72 [Aromatoleum petrolei]
MGLIDDDVCQPVFAFKRHHLGRPITVKPCPVPELHRQLQSPEPFGAFQDVIESRPGGHEPGRELE